MTLTVVGVSWTTAMATWCHTSPSQSHSIEDSEDKPPLSQSFFSGNSEKEGPALYRLAISNKDIIVAFRNATERDCLTIHMLIRDLSLFQNFLHASTV